ncbi:chromosome-anchoring protein RacA [Anoxybacillus calidus]|jgi:chromosome-anchoring protein RacA|uniref:Chromosome-anchoring protein RacA n=1 Tax=[Anoxybacillus] calidus TaxID=575178 RepID=A0A7V9YZT2_9BACL|nr:MerR family transcriptional regulator [Anoxybacillus calidus]MBA2871350.1 chromosome-anchoring protein RacA [Anoxybacillus calidus]
MELKTSSVAKRLGVSPKTVQRWIKKYNIPCPRNEAGHYVFDAETITLLEQIKFEQGAALEEESDMDIETTAKETLYPDDIFETHVKPHIEEMTARLQSVERKLEQKADDVVSFQVLQHRKEIDELVEHIQKLESRIVQLEQANRHLAAEQERLKKPKRRGLSRIISLF